MSIFEQEKIQLTLLGRLTEEVEIAIITPIESAFKKFCSSLFAEEIYTSCFFKNALFRTSNGINGIIVNIPQGMCSQDIMYAFEGVQVLFYGYAGSLKKEILVGTVLEVEMAIESVRNQFALNTISDFKRVRGGYSPCMLGDIALKYQELALKAGCHVVEMEIIACARAAIKNCNKFSAFVVVSDILQVIDFWNLDENAMTLFKRGKNKLLSYIINYVNKGDFLLKQ